MAKKNWWVAIAVRTYPAVVHTRRTFRSEVVHSAVVCTAHQRTDALLPPYTDVVHRGCGDGRGHL